MRELLTPKQVARAIGVSESSLKRWCDQGLLPSVQRTAGGHRRLALSDVLEFVREHDHRLVAPEALGLAATSTLSERGLERGLERVSVALLAGDEAVCRQVLFDLYLARHPLSTICDQVLAAAFHAIGDKWACQEADVYQERRACEIALRVLHELRQAIGVNPEGPLAIGGAIEGDFYALPTAMAELVLRSSGWNANSLGNSLPLDSVIRAITDARPRLVWLSVSYLADPAGFLRGLPRVVQASEAAGATLLIGGRALTPELLEDLAFAGVCRSMTDLERQASRTLSP